MRQTTKPKVRAVHSGKLDSYRVEASDDGVKLGLWLKNAEGEHRCRFDISEDALDQLQEAINESRSALDEKWEEDAKELRKLGVRIRKAVTPKRPE